MKPKKILTLILSTIFATTIIGCNNNVGGNSSGTNLQKSSAKISLSATDSTANSVVYMYKGAPIEANRQLIFEADSNETITHITTTNPDAGGKVYAIIVTELNIGNSSNKLGHLYQVDLTASNPIATKQTIDSFSDTMPLVSGFFSDGSGIVGTRNTMSTVDDPGTPNAFSIYKGYKYIGKNGSFFKEQIRSISVTADDTLMYIATSHHIYQSSKADIDALTTNFDANYSSTQPFHDLTDVTNLLQQTNDAIQAISFDSRGNGYMYTTNGNLYTLDNSKIINSSTPVHLLNPSESAPYVTSINFENPIYNRAVSYKNVSAATSKVWDDEKVPMETFDQMDNAVQPGLLLSFSCGDDCVKKVADNQATSMNAMNSGGAGIGVLIGDMFDGNWGWNGFAGDMVMFGVQAGAIEGISYMIDSSLTRAATSEVKASELGVKFSQLEIKDINGLTQKYNEDLNNLNLNNTQAENDLEAVNQMQHDVTIIDNRIRFDKYASSNMEPSIAHIDENGLMVNDGKFQLIDSDFASANNFNYDKMMDTEIKVNEYTVKRLQEASMTPNQIDNIVAAQNPENPNPMYENSYVVSQRVLKVRNDIAATLNVLNDAQDSLETRLAENEALKQDLIAKFPEDVATINDYNNLLEAKLANVKEQLQSIKILKYVVYSGVVINSIGFNSVHDLMGSVSANNSNSNVNTVSLAGQTADQAQHDHGFISGSFLSLNDKTLYESESGGFDMLQDSQNNNLDNIGVSVAFDGKTQYTVVAYAPYGTSDRLYTKRK